MWVFDGNTWLKLDRKYPFNLPADEERRTYVQRWNGSLRSALQISDDEVNRVASVTDGFSFAYLKKLFASVFVRWINVQHGESMGAVMLEQIEILRSQMTSIVGLPSDPGYGPQFGPQPGRLGRGFVVHGEGPQNVPL